MFKRDSLLRSSLRQKYSLKLQPKMPEGACLEVFAMHWQQAFGIMCKKDRQSQQMSPTADEVSSVINHLEQMITLLLQEAQQLADNDLLNRDSCETSANSGSILSFFLFERCLDKLLNWSLHAGDFTNILKLEQLKYYEVLVTNCYQDLLLHKPVVRPLLRLLASCSECAAIEIEKRFIILLNTLCVCITQFPILLEVFFCNNSDDESIKSEKQDEFLIFSLLIHFIHREGAIGQQARDALLLCMALSRRNESIGVYIAERSDFCPVLATGLSGLYSLLPRKFPVISEDWYQFTSEDVSNLPELAMFLNSLEFCNAVIQVAHSMVQEQLMEYLYQGFLVPVLGPALHQNAVEEIITTTAYLELFLRTITEPILLQMFLKFILTASCDGHRVLDLLIDKLGAQGQLCLVTMSLFQTLLDLNCEDVLFELVFKHLIPCSHIMVSQRSRVRDLDVYCLSANKFLSLIPNHSVIANPGITSNSNQRLPMSSKSFSSHLSNFQTVPVISKGGSLRVKRSQRSISTSSFAFGEFEHLKSYTIPTNLTMPVPSYESISSSYMDYLKDAHRNVKTCALACKSWSSAYDGLEPPSPSTHSISLLNETCVCKSHMNSDFSSKEKQTDIDLQHKNVFSTPKDSKSENVQYATEDTTKQNKQNSLFTSSSVISNLSFKHPCHIINSNDFNETNAMYNILNQIVNTDDEKTFWNLVNSTETQSSCDSLDDSLEAACDFLNDTEDTENLEIERDTNFSCEVSDVKDECSNTDSGVFDSQQSDKDTDMPEVNCAKLKNDSLFISIPTKRNSLKSSSSSISDTGSKSSNSPTSAGCWETFTTPNIGQFLSMLLTRLEMMMQNDVYTNLHLTGLISRLACYPQPLLHSFLLNPLLVFQPTVHSLLQVLGSLKHKLDSFSQAVENFDDLVNRCKQLLIAREEHLPSTATSNSMFGQQNGSSNEMQRGEPRRSSLANLFFRRSFAKQKESRANFSLNKDPTLESILDGQGYRYVSKSSENSLEREMESMKMKNAVLCSLVLEEFLKEIAAIAQEHSIVQLNPDFWGEDSYFWE